MYGGKPAVAGHLRPDVRRFGEYEVSREETVETCLRVSAGMSTDALAWLALSGRGSVAAAGDVATPSEME